MVNTKYIFTLMFLLFFSVFLKGQDSISISIEDYKELNKASRKYYQINPKYNTCKEEKNKVETIKNKLEYINDSLKNKLKSFQNCLASKETLLNNYLKCQTENETLVKYKDSIDIKNKQIEKLKTKNISIIKQNKRNKEWKNKYKKINDKYRKLSEIHNKDSIEILSLNQEVINLKNKLKIIDSLEKKNSSLISTNSKLNNALNQKIKDYFVEINNDFVSNNINEANKKIHVLKDILNDAPESDYVREKLNELKDYEYILRKFDDIKNYLAKEAYNEKKVNGFLDDLSVIESKKGYNSLKNIAIHYKDLLSNYCKVYDDAYNIMDYIYLAYTAKVAMINYEEVEKESIEPLKENYGYLYNVFRNKKSELEKGKLKKDMELKKVTCKN